MILVLYVVVGFLIGSIPFGYLIGRLFYRTDIRAHGSGNIGAMNALRTLGKAGAAAVLLLDAAKGFFPVFFLAHRGTPETLVALVGVAAVLGHCFSPWLHWKGGKGVATAFGAIFALSWKAGLVSVLTWIVAGLLISQYSSVGSMLGAAIAPVTLYLFAGSLWYAIFGVFAGALIVYTHRENIARLRTGTESKINLFKR